MSSKILLDGLVFGEGPRWREDRLWFSDMNDQKVYTVDLEGNAEVILEVPNNPSGLGWLPTGELLVVSMLDHKLMKFDGSNLTEVADMSHLAKVACNDMVVDKDGYAYVGNFGFDLNSGEPPKSTNLIGVSPEGEVKELATEMMFPNGTVITDDGNTLVVAETFAGRLTAFDINSDKSLSNRRVWAQLDGYAPDGIALDPSGDIWVATPNQPVVIRVKEGGEIIDSRKVSQNSYACAVGGENSDILFVCTATTANPDEGHLKGRGWIEMLRL